jgi:uncharacterized repeat protein (TIGR01451 family)
VKCSNKLQISQLPQTRLCLLRLALGSNATYGFTITNTGPGLAQGIEANVTIPPGLSAISAATTLGTTQITGNNFHLVVNQLATEEAVSFSNITTNLNAQGTITTTATLTASTADRFNQTIQLQSPACSPLLPLQRQHRRPVQLPRLCQLQYRTLISSSKVCRQSSKPLQPKMYSLKARWPGSRSPCLPRHGLTKKFIPGNFTDYV